MSEKRHLGFTKHLSNVSYQPFFFHKGQGHKVYSSKTAVGIRYQSHREHPIYLETVTTAGAFLKMRFVQNEGGVFRSSHVQEYDLQYFLKFKSKLNYNMRFSVPKPQWVMREYRRGFGLFWTSQGISMCTLIVHERFLISSPIEMQRRLSRIEHMTNWVTSSVTFPISLPEVRSFVGAECIHMLPLTWFSCFVFTPSLILPCSNSDLFLMPECFVICKLFYFRFIVNHRKMRRLFWSMSLFDSFVITFCLFS